MNRMMVEWRGKVKGDYTVIRAKGEWFFGGLYFTFRGLHSQFLFHVKEVLPDLARLCLSRISPLGQIGG